jgi:hypothetical protein
MNIKTRQNLQDRNLELSDFASTAAFHNAINDRLTESAAHWRLLEEQSDFYWVGLWPLGWQPPLYARDDWRAAWRPDWGRK